MKGLFVSLVLGTVALTASAQTATQPPHDTASLETITVTGTGHVTITPDRFSFNVGVQTQAASVEDAVNQNNGKVAAVIAALKQAGAAEGEIRTTGFNIYPQQDFSQQGQPPRLLGYQVSNSVTVSRKQIADAGRLLQAAIAAGVNQASGIQFEVSDPARGRDEGFKGAFDAARRTADVLATAAGRKLGRVLSITELGGMEPRPTPMVRSMAMQAKVSEVPVESGSQDLMFSVSAVFELR